MRTTYILTVSKNQIKKEAKADNHSRPSPFDVNSNEHLFFMFIRNKYFKENPPYKLPDLKMEDFVWNHEFNLIRKSDPDFDGIFGTDNPPSNGDECQCDVCQGRATDSMVLHRAKHETKIRGWDNTRVFYEDDGLGEMP